MTQVLLLIQQRSDTQLALAPAAQHHTQHQRPPLSRLPEEIWLEACTFLCSADFEL